MRLCAGLGAVPGGRKVRDHRFVVAKAYGLLVSFRRTHSPHPQLLLQEQAAFDDEHLLDDRNDDGVALIDNLGHPVDLLADRGPIDLHRFVREQFVDQLLLLVSDSRDLDAARFNNLFRDRNLFSKKRDNGLAGLVGARSSSVRDCTVASTNIASARPAASWLGPLRCCRAVVPGAGREDYRMQDRERPAVRDWNRLLCL